MAFNRRRPRRTKAQIHADDSRLQKLDLIKIEASKFDNQMLADMYVYACEQQILHDNSTFMQFMGELDQTPVSIVEFLDSKDFLG